jgi:hypothetical protein
MAKRRRSLSTLIFKVFGCRCLLNGTFETKTVGGSDVGHVQNVVLGGIRTVSVSIGLLVRTEVSELIASALERVREVLEMRRDRGGEGDKIAF